MGKAFRFVIGVVLASLILVVLTTPTAAQPNIKLSKSQGHVDQDVTVSGEGFPSDTWVLLTYDNNVLDALKTLSSGTLKDIVIQIPESTAGPHEVKVLEASDGTLLAFEAFTVIPELTLKPERGPSGSLIIATGTGYASQSDITVEYSSSVKVEVSIQGPSGGGSGGGGSGCNGKFKLALKVTVEVNVEAAVSIKAIDKEDNWDDAIFTVNPEVPPEISPEIPPDEIPQPPEEPSIPIYTWVIIGIVLLIVIIAFLVRFGKPHIPARWR